MVNVMDRSEELIKVLDYYKIEGVAQGEQKILCPFHADVNASLSINTNTGGWFCFGCQRGGDAYDFHRYYQESLGNTNDLDALIKYRTVLKSDGNHAISLLNQPNGASDTVKNRKYYRHKLREAKDYYYGLKQVDWTVNTSETQAYMEWRGYNPKTLNALDARYTYNDSYPIIFPILDNGRFRGWVSRTHNPYLEKKRKYLYNEGFRRKYTLAGVYSSDTVMVVEGYMDYAKAVQLGVHDVVAILGWKITPYQVQKLQDAGVHTVIAALDNDVYGRRGISELQKHFKTVIVFPYPEGVKDMGDMSRGQYARALRFIQSLSTSNIRR